jgi:hypothetical protein
MSSTAVAEPVRSVTVGGVTATSAMSPQEIFNAHLTAQGGQPVDFKGQGRSGMVPLHVHPSPTGGVMTGEAASGNPAPLPDHMTRPATGGGSALANNPPPPSAKLAAFDQEMRDKGIQRTDMPPPGDVDQTGIAKLNEAFQTKMRDWEALPDDARKERNVARIRAQYQEELKEFYDGRRLGEKRSEFQARRDGAAAPATQFTPGPPANPNANKAPEVSAATANMPAGWDSAIDAATKASNKYGFAPASAISGPLLHGYSIPQGREYHVAELTAALQLARKGNVTQEQLNAMAGWSKA